jgi:hypothetical protein
MNHTRGRGVGVKLRLRLLEGCLAVPWSHMTPEKTGQGSDGVGSPEQLYRFHEHASYANYPKFNLWLARTISLLSHTTARSVEIELCELRLVQ